MMTFGWWFVTILATVGSVWLYISAAESAARARGWLEECFAFACIVASVALAALAAMRWEDVLA